MGNYVQKPIIGFNPPVYFCKKATKKFVLDGDIDKEFWKEANYTADFKDIQGDTFPNPRFQTRAKMLWDNENIYFAAELIGDEIWGSIEKRDDVIFNDNDFEIFIDTNSSTHEYFEFEMNAKNTVWDLLLTKPYRDDGTPINAFDIQGLQTAVKIDGEINNPSAKSKRWTVEIVMPFSVLTQTYKKRAVPEIGEFFRMNFSRVQWTVDNIDNTFVKRLSENGNPLPEDNWVWSPTGVVDIHYPELWGYVFFTENGEEYNISSDEKIKWELRKIYYKQQEYFRENNKFCNDISVVKDDTTLEFTLETTRNSFQVYCTSEDGNRTISIFSDGKVIVE